MDNTTSKDIRQALDRLFPTQLESDDEEQQQGTNAQAVQAPKQPTPQEILEHNVTHLPYRSWCPICAQARGRQNNHPKQHSKLPIIQLDFGYIKGFDASNVHPILTAMNIQSGMIMALQLTDKRMLFDYAVTQLQHFFIECGRATHTSLQLDQENVLTALIAAVANKIGNITTRNSGAHSSQSQGGVERAHRTLFAQIRTLKAQIRQNYNRDISMKRPLMPWIVRHSAHIMNRYAVHSNGCTSYFNRRSREQHTPLCEFGETVQRMLPAVKQFPRPEPRFYNGIERGKDTTAGESLIVIYNKIVRARTTRRQIMPHDHNQQLLDCVHTGPYGRHQHQHCIHQLSQHH